MRYERRERTDGETLVSSRLLNIVCFEGGSEWLGMIIDGYIDL
jgi:hypothetical protein